MPSPRIVLGRSLRYCSSASSEQAKRANVGSITEELQAAIPHLLQKRLPEQLLSSSIQLRLFPVSHPILPVVKGVKSYTAAVRALQYVTTTFLLSPRARIHVSEIRHLEPESGAPGLGSTQAYGLYPQAHKLLVHWHAHEVTSQPQKPTTGSAAADADSSFFGSQRWNPVRLKLIISAPRVETLKTLTATPAATCVDVGEDTGSPYALKRTKEDTAGTATGVCFLRLPPRPLKLFLRAWGQSSPPLSTNLGSSSAPDRAVSGIFVFELNEACDQIIVHTIEDVEFLEKQEEALVGLAGLCPS